MPHGTAIEWTHRPGTKGESWNPVRARREVGGKVLTGWHCEHVTEACAERQNAAGARGGTRLPYKPGHRATPEQPAASAGVASGADKVNIFLDENTLQQPLRWRAPRTVFVCSMTDLFGEWVADAWLDRIFAVMALCPQHVFVLLTKRPQRMRDYLQGIEAKAATGHLRKVIRVNGWSEPALMSWPLPNVEGGVSVCDQADADAFVPLLLETPLARRFVSYEPALGPVDFTCLTIDGDSEMDALKARTWQEEWENNWKGTEGGEQRERESFLDWYGFDAMPSGALHACLDWIIAGGESGPQARPSHPDWFRSVRDQCAAAGVPFFFKQWGEWGPGAVPSARPETPNKSGA